MKELSLVHLVRPPMTGANADGVKPPLLIFLHGVGSNERDMFSLARSFDPRFVVVAARSPITLGPDSYGWFRVQFTDRGPVIDGAEAKQGWELLSRFIDEAVDAYGAAATRVFVGGFSQGGIMSINAMLTVPEKVVAAVDMASRCSSCTARVIRCLASSTGGRRARSSRSSDSPSAIMSFRSRTRSRASHSTW
jgi:phospholipase/carboxylesterase